MKDKVLFLIIGILIGVMIATGVFIIIDKNEETDISNIESYRNFNHGEMTEGGMSERM